MGQVWLARDERNGRDVALKIVAREGKAGSRAEREARAAAALRHDRCQRVLSLARDSSHVYIAYEYIPGRTLREALRGGALTDRDALEVAAQIAEALRHAHKRGIIHRDVKPANILLAESDEIDVRLLDFGLAQMEEFDTLTALGDIPGTLAYISPERLQGLPATTAADIWAVGVILFEALAGEHPFWGGDLVETSRRIQGGAPDLRILRPDLPEHVRQVVASALTVNPQRRPAAGALADELRAAPKRVRRRGSGSGSKSGSLARPGLQLRKEVLTERVLPAALAGLATGWVASRLPFYPPGATIGLAGTAAALGFTAPRAGLAFTLVAAFFPLANISLGLGLLFAAVGILWLALTWRDPRAGLALAVGPVLGAFAALALIPLALQFVHGRVRRGVQAGAGVLLAALIAGLSHASLPFEGSLAPLGLGISGSTRPGAVADAFWRQLTSHPALLAEAVVLAIAAALLPSIRGRGPWAAAQFGALMLVATGIVAPHAALLPLVAAAWVTAAVLAVERRS
jgi:hypothetical protein